MDVLNFLGFATFIRRELLRMFYSLRWKMSQKRLGSNPISTRVHCCSGLRDIWVSGCRHVLRLHQDIHRDL